MLTYCVKQRKKTKCVPGSEKLVVMKNGRNAMKCRCSECGITKFSFVKSIKGSGTVDLLDKIPGFGESRKILGKIIPAIITERGAKESFDDFASGKTFKNAWAGMMFSLVKEKMKKCENKVIKK